MSSDHFLHFQKILRDVKEQHNIDLTSPNGATIGDKKYPATHKNVYLGPDADHSSGDYDVDFNIPFENGTQLNVTANKSGFMSSQLHVPTIHLHGDGRKTYRHGPALHIGEDSFYNNHKSIWDYTPMVDVHKVINKYSTLPHQGTYDWDYSQEGGAAFKRVRPNAEAGMFGLADIEDHALNPEELQEHNNNHKFNPVRGPLHIRAAFWRPESGRTNLYRYNTQTEQLHTIDGNED